RRPARTLLRVASRGPDDETRTADPALDEPAKDRGRRASATNRRRGVALREARASGESRRHLRPGRLVHERGMRVRADRPVLDRDAFLAALQRLPHPDLLLARARISDATPIIRV